jgi:hypothetical protein
MSRTSGDSELLNIFDGFLLETVANRSSFSNNLQFFSPISCIIRAGISEKESLKTTQEVNLDSPSLVNSI